MSRTRRVHVDEKLSGYFDSLVQKRRIFEIGLLIGHTLSISNSNDFIQTAVQIPSETEEETASLNDISPEWVQEISKQVDRLLPGGFSIVGLYVLSSDSSRIVFDKCSLFIHSLAETLALSRLLVPSSSFSVEKEDFFHVVHICPQSNKTSVKTFFQQNDAKKAVSLPAEIKLNVKSCGLIRFETSILLNELVYLSPSSMSPSDLIEDKMKEIVTQLDPFANKVVNAIGIILGGKDPNRHKEIKLLTSNFSSSSHDVSTGSKEEKEDDLVKKIPTKIQGLIKCLAYVPQEEEKNMDKIVKFLKQDFFKSLGTRLEILVEKWTEEIQDAEEEDEEIHLSYGGDALLSMSSKEKTTGSISLPYRIVFPWIVKEQALQKNLIAFDVSLLVFDDNDLSNCIQTTLELLGLSSLEHDIISSIVCLEKKSSSTLPSGPSINRHISNNIIKSDTTKSSNTLNNTTAVSSTTGTLSTGLMYVIFAFLVLVIAVLVNFSMFN